MNVLRKRRRLGALICSVLLMAVLLAGCGLQKPETVLDASYYDWHSYENRYFKWNGATYQSLNRSTLPDELLQPDALKAPVTVYFQVEEDWVKLVEDGSFDTAPYYLFASREEEDLLLLIPAKKSFSLFSNDRPLAYAVRRCQDE